MSSSRSSNFPLLSLPSELLLHTLSYLPITSLLAVATTNHAFYDLSLAALSSLRLTSFPKRIHTTLATLDLDANGSVSNQDSSVDLNLPPSSTFGSPSSSRRTSPARSHRNRSTSPESDPKVIRNAILDALSASLLTVFTSPSIQKATNLHTLSIQTWTPNEALLSQLATSPSMRNLRNLTLDFFHPNHRNPTLPSYFWDSADQPSPIWNSISGLGNNHADNLQLRNLETLSLSRCGINPHQLRTLIQSNMRLRSLRLKMVRGVDEEFLSSVASRQIQATDLENHQHSRHSTRPVVLETLEITNCVGLTLPDTVPTDPDSNSDSDSEDPGYTHLSTLARHGLRKLAVKLCPGVADTATLRRLNKTLWHIPSFEVDEERRPSLDAIDGDMLNSLAATARATMGPIEVDEDAMVDERWVSSVSGFKFENRRPCGVGLGC